jgi:hypothetical protein
MNIPDEILNKLRKHHEDLVMREQKFGNIRPIIHGDFNEHKFVAVGSELYFKKNWRTFGDFLLDYIVNVLGGEWGNSELRKPFEKRHQILKWYDGLCKFQRQQVKGPDGLYSGILNGVSAAYILLSYDLYLLRHHGRIQREIINRLKHPGQFQGARYELFAAATCVRAGFGIEYENERDGSMKHAEFIATHKDTGQKISVEAKSRHRAGILDFPGLILPHSKIRTRIGGLLNSALKKATSLPLIIFIDVNVPPEKAFDLFLPPPNEFSRLVERIGKTNDGKDKFNLLIFTNHPHHYGRDDQPDPRKDMQSVFSYGPRIEPEHPDVILNLNNAVLQYGNIPDFPEN